MHSSQNSQLRLAQAFFIISLFAFSILSRLNAQSSTCDCSADLEYLNQLIEKTPSFKLHKTEYKETYAAITKTASPENSYFECFELLNRVLIPLKDWHAGIIEPQSDDGTNSPVAYPFYNEYLSSLSNVLRTKALKDLEGVYYIGKTLSFGLVYDEVDNAYDAVILESRTDNWKKGEVIYRLIPLAGDAFKLIGAQYPTKRLISYHERIDRGLFLRAGIKKDSSSTYFNKSPFPDEALIFKALSPEIDYLKIGSFSSYNPFLSEAEAFYASLKGQLHKPHLILDLRDNGGGGERNSDLLLKLLKPYLKQHQIHVITNASTGSNAERFTVILKQFKNTRTYGDRTRGALAYEIRSDDYHQLPSSGFTVILPSKVDRKFLDYETNGVVPDIYLGYKKNWIDAITSRIEDQN